MNNMDKKLAAIELSNLKPEVDKEVEVDVREINSPAAHTRRQATLGHTYGKTSQVYL